MIGPKSDRKELATYFAELGFTKGAEIGVAWGRYSLILCNSIPKLTLICVDPWEVYKGNRRGGHQDHHSFNEVKARRILAGFDVTFCKGKSMEMVELVPDESLDFVFVDGNHDYEFVLEDITAWSKKVKKGGIVSGHDYYQFNHSGVIEAVDKYVADNKIDLHIISGENAGNRDDRHPCFWWFK